MPALWVCWSAEKFDPEKEKINGLRQSVDWDKAVINEISGDIFLGSFFHDTSNKFDLSNFYYSDLQNSFCILVTGYIYNLHELLNTNIYSREPSTPEAIFHLYSLYKDEIFNKLNGDYCIAIIDRKNNSIVVARDHIGIHPCAFYYLNQHLYFSTDCIALAKVFQDQDPINCQYLLNQLDVAHIWDYQSLPNSKVHKLLPGHLLKIEHGNLTVTKYWKPEKIKINRKLTWDEIIDNFRTILQDAVKIRAVPHCKSAVHLSGGLDSGIVAALARKEYKNQKIFHGYSWSPQEGNKNTELSQEANRIKIQSESLNIKPEFQNLNLEEFIAYISNWRYELYIFHELKVLEEARMNHEQLIFSGWGGDEFLSINNDGIDSDLIFGFQWKSFLKKYPLHSPRRLIGGLYYNVILPLVYHHPHRQGSGLDFFSRYIYSKKCPSFTNRINLAKWKSRREVHLKLLYYNHIAARSENFFNLGIRYGIEYRFPLLDKRIIEYMLSVPSKFLFKDNYVRRILRELSDEFLPTELNWIDQKQEPGLYEEDKKLRKIATDEIIKELKEYKKLPEFGIFNFEQLEKDIDLYKNDKFTLDTDMLCLFLVVLKKRYEFIKGYKNAEIHTQQ